MNTVQTGEQYVKNQIVTFQMNLSRPIRICLNTDPHEVTTHSNSQLGGDVTGASTRDLWVKVGSRAAQEARLQNVSTATIGEEATLVQVHLLPGSLEVQGH